MTPALLLALKQERMYHYEALAVPIDKLAYLYASAHNSGKYDDKGKLIEAAKPLNIEDFRTHYRRNGGGSSGNLAAKVKAANKPGYDPSLDGAMADRGQFEAWAGSRAGNLFVPTKED